MEWFHSVYSAHVLENLQKFNQWHMSPVLRLKSRMARGIRHYLHLYTYFTAQGERFEGTRTKVIKFGRRVSSSIRVGRDVIPKR